LNEKESGGLRTLETATEDGVKIGASGSQEYIGIIDQNYSATM
jgi:hypothetical protein